MVLALVDLLVLAMTIGGLHGWLRISLGLVLGLVIPGWSVVGLLRLQYAALEIGLAVAVSLALLMVTAQVLITAHAWHLVGLQVVTCVLCLPSRRARDQRR
jgi:uncharacterized membrane protein